MQSQSRRAFLRARRVSPSPWECFCQNLRAAARGGVVVHAEHAASLSLGQASDAHRARTLCAQYGVALALDDGKARAPSPDRPVLWVHPGPALNTCQRLAPGAGAWFVQPGCRLGDLVAAGLTGFARWPAPLTIAAWLADRDICDWATGTTAHSGVTHASVLLADGSSVVLGPFGAGQASPLKTAAQRRLVSGLFALTTSAAAQLCLAAPAWPARYRLDALCPRAQADANLAQVLCGHGGNLAWVEWLVLDERWLGQALPCDPRRQRGDGDDATSCAAAQTLDAQIKTLFDPRGLFGIDHKLYTSGFS